MLSLLRLECKQKKFFKSIFNSHTTLSFLLIWNWNHKYFHTLCSSLENHTCFQTKMRKVYISVFRPKQRKNPTWWGGTYLYSLYKGVPTLGQQGCHYHQISHPNSPIITFTISNYIHYIQEWVLKKVAPWDYKGVSLSTDFLDKGH